MALGCTSIRCACGPLIQNFPAELVLRPATQTFTIGSDYGRRRRTGIRMTHAKFRADPLKTAAVHKEQRTDRRTDKHAHRFLYNII